MGMTLVEPPPPLPPTKWRGAVGAMLRSRSPTAGDDVAPLGRPPLPWRGCSTPVPFDEVCITPPAVGGEAPLEVHIPSPSVKLRPTATAVTSNADLIPTRGIACLPLLRPDGGRHPRRPPEPSVSARPLIYLQKRRRPLANRVATRT